MYLVVVSDIFGRTPELESLVSAIAAQYTEVVLLDPYAGTFIDFDNENDAYAYFRKTVGLREYRQTVLEAVRQVAEESRLLGFSVGAAALWAISEERVFHPETRMLGFYGSQIRNLLEINPAMSVDLYFPKHETHFHVLELMRNVAPKRHVRCFQTGYLHGFMNKRSANFDEAGYIAHVRMLESLHERRIE